jgi:RNA polymerase sigma-70 factor (ECF subfamily)
MEPTLRARVRAGDPDAFGVLFDDHARAVFNHAFRMTSDWSLAEEAVSLTFLEAWRLRGRLEPEGGSLRPWLLGITLNVIRNMNRAARRHQAAMSRLPAVPPVPDFAEDLAARMDEAIRWRRVSCALAALRQGERDVLALCVWAGLDYAAAASALGVPVGTIRSRLSRARRKLRELVAAGDLQDAHQEREPIAIRGQLRGDRDTAVRPLQEGTR